MATAQINPGICGLRTTVSAQLGEDGMTCTLAVTSDCPHVTALGNSLRTVNPFEEISFRGEGPAALRAAAEHCPHPACPVPQGIIKAVEVAAGLALPATATIEVTDA